MNKLNSLASKYASGGAVDRASGILDTIQTALHHIKNGDHKKAADTLAADPIAMRHPDVAAAVPQLHAAAQQRFDVGGPVQGQPQVATPQPAAAAMPPPQPMQPGAMSAQVAGGGDIMDSIVNTMKQKPETAPILKAHALALLRANLNAAHAIHTLTGDPSAYGHYTQGSRVLSQALGGNSDSITAQMVAQEMGQSGQGGAAMSTAQGAVQAANQAVPPPRSSP